MSTDKKFAALAFMLLMGLVGSIVTALLTSPAYAVYVILGMVAGGFGMLFTVTLMQKR
ncbi:MAG TPA: hypothetical protein VEB64_18940 [Azospirillaceae bacterium]|nr:hypothetical protein [Azospirillaceae bacterium]